MVKVCPLLSARTGRIIEERMPQPCLQERCMWWIDGECAIALIAKKLKI